MDATNDIEKPAEVQKVPKPLFLENLEMGINKRPVVVRLLRMWECRNFKLNNSLMSLDMLLLDEKETLIRASIHHRRIHRFKDVLKEGSVYQFSNLEVVTSYSHYKVTDNPLTIRFLDNSQVMEVGEDISKIKREKFRIHSYAEFENFAGSNLHLLDVVGQIVEVQGLQVDDSNSHQKILLLLSLQDNSTIRVTLWDEQASDFRKQFKETDQGFHIIVCTCLNPKMFAGKLHLNSSAATKLYVDSKLDAVADFLKRKGNGTVLTTPRIVGSHSNNEDLELWTVDDLYNYIASGTSETKEVVCRATITEINSRNGWKYLSCGACSKKLVESETSLICNHCNKTSTIGVARFRVELTVGCVENTTTFVMFDRDTKKLTNTTADAILERQAEQEDAGTGDNIPQSLLDLIGKTLNFHVKISEFNFQASVQYFTVARVLKDTWLPQPKVNDVKDGSVKIKTEDGEIPPTFQTSEMEHNIGQKDSTSQRIPLESDDEKGSKKARVI